MTYKAGVNFQNYMVNYVTEQQLCEIGHFNSDPEIIRQGKYVTEYKYNCEQLYELSMLYMKVFDHQELTYLLTIDHIHDFSKIIIADKIGSQRDVAKMNDKLESKRVKITKREINSTTAELEMMIGEIKVKANCSRKLIGNTEKECEDHIQKKKAELEISEMNDDKMCFSTFIEKITNRNRHCFYYIEICGELPFSYSVINHREAIYFKIMLKSIILKLMKLKEVEYYPICLNKKSVFFMNNEDGSFDIHFNYNNLVRKKDQDLKEIIKYEGLPVNEDELPDLEKRTVLWLGIYVALNFLEYYTLKDLIEVYGNGSEVLDETTIKGVLSSIKLCYSKTEKLSLLDSMLELKSEKRVGYKEILDFVGS